MKIGTWGKNIAFIYAIICFQFCFAGYFRPPLVRQFNQVPINIGHQHIHQNPKQLLFTLKQSIHDSKKIKSDILYGIAAAIGNNTKFKPFLSQEKVIEQSIGQFYDVPGYLRVFFRVIESTVNKNIPNFNGAMAEIELAYKLCEEKKILEFNRIITNEKGKTLTEIDIEAEDQYGKKSWYEVKIRKKQSSAHDITFILKQRDVQKSLAKSHEINEHIVIIAKNLKEIACFKSITDKKVKTFTSKIVDGNGNIYASLDSETEDDAEFDSDTDYNPAFESDTEDD